MNRFGDVYLFMEQEERSPSALQQALGQVRKAATTKGSAPNVESNHLSNKINRVSMKDIHEKT